VNSPFDASAMAVYFNGMAAQLAFEQVGLHMVATDLIENLPKVLMPFDKISS
jgi:ADP-dependent NAD(P)H-hydrate dehydratase